MKTNQETFFSLFFTHTLLIVTATTCITILTTISHWMFVLPIAYGLAVAIAIYKKNISLVTLIACSLLCSLFAIVRINQQYTQYNSHQEFFKKPVTIKGIILQINKSNLTREQTTITLQTTSIQKNKCTVAISRTISLFLPTKTTSNLEENQTIKVYNVTLEHPQQDNDYQRYLIKENIWAVAHCSLYGIQITQQATSSLRKKCLTLFNNNLTEATSSLFYPLFLGKKEKNVDIVTIQHSSVYWGIAHHMARSGVHLGVLFGLLMLLFHYASIAHIFRYLLCSLMLIGYAYISFSSISFLRALFMILLHIICKLLKRMPSTLHILTLATLFTILYNPMQLFFLDFQLSFGITYIIIWLFASKKSKTIAFTHRTSVQS